MVNKLRFVYLVFREHFSVSVWVTCLSANRIGLYPVLLLLFVTKSLNATCFTMFPCVSLGTHAHITVLLVMCSTLSIVLTRPTDAWRLKRKRKMMSSSREVFSTWSRSVGSVLKVNYFRWYLVLHESRLIKSKILHG